MRFGLKRRWQALSAAGLAVAAIAAGAANAAGSFAIRNGTIAGGGGIGTGDCYALVGTIGEAVAGTTAEGPYRITSGFPATIGSDEGSSPIPVGDDIFGNGFEGNGGCAP